MLFIISATKYFSLHKIQLARITEHCSISYTHAKNVICEITSDNETIREDLVNLGFVSVTSIKILQHIKKHNLKMKKIHDFTAQSIQGKNINFSDFTGKVLLIVNTASKCGLTPQYEGLEELHQQFKDQGLVIIGFPCNQFGNQEQGDESEISEFCQINFGVSFQMMQKINVNGDDAHELYQWLKRQKGGVLTSSIKWNFTKFLIGRDGKVIDRFAPTTQPEKLTNIITQALHAKS